MKKVWPIVRLGDVCETGAGGTPLKLRREYYDGGTIPWLLSGEVGQGEIYASKNFITQAGLDNSAAKIFPEGTVLVAMYGATAGQAGILRFPAATNQAVCGILPNSKFIQEFLLYFLLSKRDELVAQATGNAQPNISQIKVRNINVPLVDRTEQQRIVGILDEAFAGLATAKANAEKNLQNTRGLFESCLRSTFAHGGTDWTEKPLSQLCEPDRVITYGVVQLGEEKANGTPCLRTSNVRWLRIDTEVVKKIAPELSNNYSRTILRGGEVLVNVRGTLGGVGVVSAEMRGWNVSREVAVAAVDSRTVDPYFVAYSVGAGVSQEWLSAVKKGAAYVGINIEDLRNLPVRFPVRKEQIRMVQHLNSVSAETQRLESLYQRKLTALDELKKSLLHQAFTGAL